MNHKIRLLFAMFFLITNLFSFACSKKEKSGNNNSSNNKSAATSDLPKSEFKSGGFAGNLPGGFQMPNEAVGKKILKEYGALFVAKGDAVPPNTVIFKNEEEVSAYQTSVSKSSEKIGGIKVELQTAAMNALLSAADEAKQKSLTITPRGDDASKRTYTLTVELWASRVNPGLTYWVGKGRLPQAEAGRIKALAPFEQVPEIFKLEEQGMFFAKDLSKSIMYSVAPPGASQHLSMLALDISEFENPKVREILARHGWFQTVVSDLPHFTYLGVAENELTKLGLKKTSDGGRNFWIPDN